MLTLITERMKILDLREIVELEIQLELNESSFKEQIIHLVH